MVKQLFSFLIIFLCSSALFAQDKPDSLVFSDAVYLAQQALDSMGMSATIMGGATFYGPGNDDNGGEGHDDSYPSDSTMWSGGRTPNFTGLNSQFTLVRSEHEDDSLGHGPDKPMAPNGYAMMWEVYAYEASMDSMIAMLVGADGVMYYELFGEADVEDEVDFSLMKPLPQEYVDSDSAVMIAQNLGGAMFLQEYAPTGEEVFLFWDMEVHALHEYWSFPEQDPAEVPFMWSVNYYGVSADITGKLSAEEYVIYLDIVTGDTVYTERYTVDLEQYVEPKGLVFSDAVYLAQQALDSMGVSATIMGGSTYYSPGNDDNGGEGHDDSYPSDSTMWSGGRTPNFTGLNSQFTLVRSEHEDDSLGHGPGKPMAPNGYAMMWEVYAYEASMDSMIAMAVGMDGVTYYELFGEGDVEDEVDFSLMKPLPQEYVNSDLAVMKAEELGGAMFRQEYSPTGEEVFLFWDMEVYALHEYWSFPEQDPAEVPFMWSVNYYGVSADMYGNVKAEEYVIYLDVVTGDTVYTERYTVDFEEFIEPEGLVFSDAVYLAQQALDSMGVSATIMGGSTYYGYGNHDNGEDGYDDSYPSDSTMWSGGRTPNFTGLNSQFTLVRSEHEDDSLGHGPGIPMIPNGYAMMWEVYAYEASLDSMIAMAVGMDGVMYYELFGEGDVEEEVDFSLMKPLPEEYVDSDELFMMIFEQAFSSVDDITTLLLPEIPTGINVAMDMDVSILHNYWSLPVDLAPELIPLTWHMTMYATAMDSMGNVVMEDSLSMFMDAETGNLLYSSMDVTNSETEKYEPVSITLHQNYPNPFNPTTSISFELNKAQDVSLVVYNLLGQQVLTLVNDRLQSGQHRINVNASNLASGIYMYRLTTNSQSLTKKMTLIK